MSKYIILQPKEARRVEDPAHDFIFHHIMLVPASSLSMPIPDGPNARKPSTNKQVYRNVDKSLINENGEPNTFHLKNMGIYLNASKVEPFKQQGKTAYKVWFDDPETHGCMNGGHTLSIIQKRIASGEVPPNQYVRIEILTGVPEEWIAEIVGGLNTSVQVQTMSISNLDGKLDWLKDQLKTEPYYDKIAWSENDDGQVDARELIALINCFNIEAYPNDGIDKTHPITSYTSKETTFRKFLAFESGFKKAKKIAPDILRLYDVIRKDFCTIHNTTGGKSGALNIVDYKKGKPYYLPFIRKDVERRLQTGPAYSILAAFRRYVELDNAGMYRWVGGFSNVLRAWDEIGPELVRMTAYAAIAERKDSNMIGKDLRHWEFLHQTVLVRELQRQQKVA